MPHQVVAVDRVDVDNGHVEAAQRPNDHLEAEEKPDPLMCFPSDHMAAHYLMTGPKRVWQWGGQLCRPPQFSVTMTEATLSR